MKIFSEFRAIYCQDTNIDIDESFSLFKRSEQTPHRIAVRYEIASTAKTGSKSYETTLPKIYPSEKHAVNDMKNVRQPHYTAMMVQPYHESKSLAEEDKKEKKYNENNFAVLQNIVSKNKGDKLKFKDESDLDVGVKQANAILSTHARLNGGNKKKITNMLHIGKRHFVKLANFCQANYAEK